MTSANLRCEYRAALSRTTPEDLRPLRDAGVGAGLDIGIAVAPISVSRGGFYQPDPDGGLAFLIPVCVETALTPEAADPVATVRHGGEIIDLLAITPAFPRRWALRTGAAVWLGAVEPQFLDPAPTPIWRSPIRWLGNDCQGLVLLSRDKRDRYRTLTCLGAIVAEDEEHAAVLRQLLQQPWLSPPVYVRRGREVRNAA